MPVFAGLLCVGAKAYPEEVQSGLLRDTMPTAWTLERTNFQTVPTPVSYTHLTLPTNSLV